jgi:hypothetical protein
MFSKLMDEKKEAILTRWVDLIFKTYPADSHGFFTNNSDPFGNPVGTAVKRETRAIFDELRGEFDPENIEKSLDAVIRIRAVQEFSSSRAVSFIFMLKQAVLEELKGDLGDAGILKDVITLFGRIDEMALAAFDIHMDCREKVNKIRLDEAKRRVAFNLAERHRGSRRKPEDLNDGE